MLPFKETLKRQEELVLQRQAEEIEDQFLFLEHAPIYTIGRLKDQSSLRHRELLPHPVCEINRGGQATYHGPGQLVGYAIWDLKKRSRDLHLHLRILEEALILSLADYDVKAERREGLTGVWCDNRKIASLGVGVRKWVSMHGFAINIETTSLQGFQPITPCGIEGVSVTTLENESGQKHSSHKFSLRVQSHLEQLR